MSLGFQSSSNTPINFTDPAFQALAGPLAKQFRDLLGLDGGSVFEGNLFSGVGSPGQPNRGFAATLSGTEKKALSGLDASVAGGPFAGERDLFLTKSLRGDFLGPDSNPFLQDTIDAASRGLRRDRDEGLLQRQALFSRAGQKLSESSPFSRAQSISDAGFSDAIGDVAAKIAGENFQKASDRQSLAASQSTELDRVNFENQIKNLEAQALPRLIDQLGIDKGLAEFNNRLNLLAQIFGLATGAQQPNLANKQSSFGLDVGFGGLTGDAAVALGGGGGVAR